VTDPIGGAVARAFSDLASRRASLQDNGAVTVPVLGGGNSDGPSFGDTLTKAINGVSSQQDGAANTLQAFLRGDDVELHQVMAATEEAQISLEMLIEVRNKFTEAYRTLSTMQG